MNCPICGNPLPDQIAVCPYCNTELEYETINETNTNSYAKAYCSIDTVQLRKLHQIISISVAVICAVLLIFAVFLQYKTPSLSVQMANANAFTIASLCAEHPKELEEGEYHTEISYAITELQRQYEQDNTTYSEIMTAFQQIASISDMQIQEQACNAAATIESNQLLQEINRIRNQRKKLLLSADTTLTDAAQLLIKTYQESPNTYEEDAFDVLQGVLPDAESVYHIALLHCENYEMAISQYSDNEKNIPVNVLTTQDYTKIGICGMYDATQKQFYFILLLQ